MHCVSHPHRRPGGRFMSRTNEGLLVLALGGLALLGVLALVGGAGFFFTTTTVTSAVAQADPVADPEPAPQEAGRPQFAQDRDPVKVKEVPFEANRAMDYLTQICKIGPRVSGSEGMKEQQKLLEQHFGKFDAKVTWQKFPARQRSRKADVAMANLIVSWHPDRTRRVILCSHYDTRPVADQEPNRGDWNKPFVSANDGASGVAWMMELAHHMKDLPTKVGVDFVLFDGEEYVFDTGPLGTDKYFFGSEHFAGEYAKNKAKLPYRYEAAVLLDLFAGKDARYPVEMNSWAAAQNLVTEVWKTAADLGEKSFVLDRGPEVNDDHLALNRAGIPAIDIIDFDYRHWHKLSDTPDKCSPQQMAAVAKVLTTWLQRIK
jgi:hypothetical protein